MAERTSYTVTREHDDWIVMRDAGGREVIRVKLPPGGVTMAEVETFRRHLLMVVKGKGEA